MSNILVVTGSIRPNSVNEKLIPVVVDEIDKLGATVTVADLKELDLPFFDHPLSPSNPEFKATDERVINWTNMVDVADAVVLVTPTYNHTLSPVQINAIDWIGREWKNKKVALVGYGWGNGGKDAHDAARNALSRELAANVSEKQTNLSFMEQINPDGSLIDEEASRADIAETVKTVLS